MKTKLYSIRLLVILCVWLLAAGAFMGLFYNLRIFDLQLAALLQRIFIDFSIIASALLALILIMTFLFGRLYCSVLCPFGILQEFIGIIKNIFGRKTSVRQKNLPLKYIIAAIVFGSLAGGTVYLLRLSEPYTYFGSLFTLSTVGITASAVIIIILLINGRFFCANLCPVGTVLGLISKFSLNKIYLQKDTCGSCGLCEKVCSAGCINSKEKTVDNEICLKCLKCVRYCPKNSVNYGAAPKEEIKFSPKRRRLIFAASTAAVFAAAAKAGAVIKKTISQNFSDVILPPGALNEERFANKCLNCNLCVMVCPTKIIKKADGKYGAVSIDYSKGFCDYTCNKCAEACPAGAIKKLSLSQKQSTRIAMIAPPAVKCDEAVNACPTQALIKNGDDKPVFSASKCIGCATCKAQSPETNIQIYGVKNQKMF